jgi:hypothetical protein
MLTAAKVPVMIHDLHFGSSQPTANIREKPHSAGPDMDDVSGHL